MHFTAIRIVIDTACLQNIKKTFFIHLFLSLALHRIKMANSPPSIRAFISRGYTNVQIHAISLFIQKKIKLDSHKQKKNECKIKKKEKLFQLCNEMRNVLQMNETNSFLAHFLCGVKREHI